MGRRVDHRITLVQPSGDIHVDLVDQDHRIADDHPAQRDDAEDRDKTHRRPGRQQREHDADQPQWGHADHQKHLLEALQLNHQDGQHQEDHHRENDGDRAQALGALLHGAAGFDLIARRQFLLQLGKGRRQLGIDGLRLDSGNDIRLNRDGREKIAPPYYRLFEPILDGRDLAQGDRLSIIERYLQISQCLQRLALLVE